MAHPSGSTGSRFQPLHSFTRALALVGPNGYKFQSTTGEQIKAQQGQARDGVTETIVFHGERNRHGSVCHACWGYRIDCNGSYIGQCAEALDMALP